MKLIRGKASKGLAGVAIIVMLLLASFAVLPATSATRIKEAWNKDGDFELGSFDSGDRYDENYVDAPWGKDSWGVHGYVWGKNGQEQPISHCRFASWGHTGYLYGHYEGGDGTYGVVRYIQGDVWGNHQDDWYCPSPLPIKDKKLTLTIDLYRDTNIKHRSDSWIMFAVNIWLKSPELIDPNDPSKPDKIVMDLIFYGGQPEHKRDESAYHYQYFIGETPYREWKTWSIDISWHINNMLAWLYQEYGIFGISDTLEICQLEFLIELQNDAEAACSIDNFYLYYETEYPKSVFELLKRPNEQYIALRVYEVPLYENGNFMGYRSYTIAIYYDQSGITGSAVIDDSTGILLKSNEIRYSILEIPALIWFYGFNPASYTTKYNEFNKWAEWFKGNATNLRLEAAKSLIGFSSFWYSIIVPSTLLVQSLAYFYSTTIMLPPLMLFLWDLFSMDPRTIVVGPVLAGAMLALADFFDGGIFKRENIAQQAARTANAFLAMTPSGTTWQISWELAQDASPKSSSSLYKTFWWYRIALETFYHNSFIAFWLSEEEKQAAEDVISQLKNVEDELYSKSLEINNIVTNLWSKNRALRILTPTTDRPALAGDPNNPAHVMVSISGVPPMKTPAFTVEIGGKQASYELVDEQMQDYGIYTLKVLPPKQDSEGKYDLVVTVSYDDFSDMDIQEGAVEYRKVTVAEPVEKGLTWLRSTQNDDGSWTYFGRKNVGLTSLCALAFLNNGIINDDVKKALGWILSQRKDEGSITAGPGGWPYREDVRVYDTSMAILALVAAKGLGYSPENVDLDEVISKAVDFLLRCQCVGQSFDGYNYSYDDFNYGGWGYPRYHWADLSNTQFAVLALDQAVSAGISTIDSKVWEDVAIFTIRCLSDPDYNPKWYKSTDKGFKYRPTDSRSRGSMTGAGIWTLGLCKLHGVTSVKVDGVTVSLDDAINDGLAWLDQFGYVDQNYPIGKTWYYYYLLSVAKGYVIVGQGEDWYEDMVQQLASIQASDGHWPSYYSEEPSILATAEAILAIQTRAIPMKPENLRYLSFSLYSNALFRITDPLGRTVGYNYITQKGENNIPTAVYSGPFKKPQYVVIVEPEPGTYSIELIGTSEGQYTLCIQGYYGSDLTDAYEFIEEIKPAELYRSNVAVTAVVGPMDIYTSPPEYEEIIDNIPPVTQLLIGEPTHTDPMNNRYVSSATKITLIAQDNIGGIGVGLTAYRIYNATYDSGWLNYTGPFSLAGLKDGIYKIDYNSTDYLGNAEPTNTITVILDNTPPITNISIHEPKYVSNAIYVTPNTPLILKADDYDGSGIKLIAYRIINATYDSGWLNYTGPFTLESLNDGVYTIAYNSTDNVNNIETTHYINVTLFSWDYIFEDSFGRGTILKISIKHKFFQFITPDKDYGIRNATYMRVCRRAIVIHHKDSELRLVTLGVNTKLDLCVAIAWDKQTNTRYFLLDKIGQEN